MPTINKGQTYESIFFGRVTVTSVDAYSVWFRDSNGYRDSLSYASFVHLTTTQRRQQPDRRESR